MVLDILVVLDFRERAGEGGCGWADGYFADSFWCSASLSSWMMDISSSEKTMGMAFFIASSFTASSFTASSFAAASFAALSDTMI